MIEGDIASRGEGAAELQHLLTEFVRGVESLPLPEREADRRLERSPLAPGSGAAERMSGDDRLPPLPAGGVSSLEAFAAARRGEAQIDVPFPTLCLDLPEAEEAPRARERVQPHAALEAFPHVLEGLALLWNDDACRAYLQRLVVDTRGGRRGFPPDAMDELLFLFELHTRRV